MTLNHKWISVHYSSELIITGDWLREFDFTKPKHINATIAPGRIEITQRTQSIFRA